MKKKQQGPHEKKPRYRRCKKCSRRYAASGYRTYCVECGIWIQEHPDPWFLEGVRY